MELNRLIHKEFKLILFMVYAKQFKIIFQSKKVKCKNWLIQAWVGPCYSPCPNSRLVPPLTAYFQLFQQQCHFFPVVNFYLGKFQFFLILFLFIFSINFHQFLLLSNYHTEKKVSFQSQHGIRLRIGIHEKSSEYDFNWLIATNHSASFQNMNDF